MFNNLPLFYTNLNSLTRMFITLLLWVIIQRERCVFYISHYTATKINPFHVCSVAENTTEINHTGKVIFFILDGVIVERIIFYQFNQYLCFYHAIAWKWKSSCKRLIYVCWTRYSVKIIVKKINIYQQTIRTLRNHWYS